MTRAAIQGIKLVTGDTSSWIRPAQFHITCSGPDFELDIDIEPPVGPGGPGTYIIGQGSIPPGTCTISETDTGSDEARRGVDGGDEPRHPRRLGHHRR